MYFSLIHFTSHLLQKKLATLIAEHPYYGAGGENPILVTARSGFDFKKMPCVLVHTPTGTDRFLDIGQFITEVRGHVQWSQKSFFFSEVYQAPADPIYPVVFADETYTLTITAETKVTIVRESDSYEVVKDIVEDEEYDDWIPGVIIRTPSFNNIITVGQVAVIKTYAEERLVGELIGAEWPLSCSIDCYARTLDEARDTADLVTGILAVSRDDFYNKDGIQGRHISIAGEADNPGDTGEEVYGHTINMDFALEWRVFRPKEIFKGWRLTISVVPPDAYFPDIEVSGGSQEE